MGDVGVEFSDLDDGAGAEVQRASKAVRFGSILEVGKACSITAREIPPCFIQAQKMGCSFKPKFKLSEYLFSDERIQFIHAVSLFDAVSLILIA